MTSKKSTKQLAWELGLVRKRTNSIPLSNGSKKCKPDAQQFSYLIVIDFESTCWENDKTIPQEIIEFPAVLINCITGEVEAEFHHFIQPSEKTSLSEFCQQLTGISQDDVDNGIPLAVCLRKFLIWLRKLQRDKGIVCADDKNLSLQKNGKFPNGTKLAAFVTWSDWDLGVCLLYETKRKQIMKPSALDRWIDLRATYRKFYSRRPDGLSGALKDLGINFDGRQHSGLDDAKNTAKLAYRMICDGCVLSITKALKTSPFTVTERISFPIPSSTTGSLNNDCMQHAMKNKTDTKTCCGTTVTDSAHLCNKKSSRNISGNLKLSERNANLPPSSRNSGNITILQTKTASTLSNKTLVTTSLLKSPDRSSNVIERMSPIDSPRTSKVSRPTHLKNRSLNHCANTSLQLPSRNLSNSSSRVQSKLMIPFKTPSPGEPQLLVRVTPPLCTCGRRSKRRCVQNPGPNIGRYFYSCPTNNSSCQAKSKGCEFFKWETPPSGIKMPR